jgi:hypothetical protein
MPSGSLLTAGTGNQRNGHHDMHPGQHFSNYGFSTKITAGSDFYLHEKRFRARIEDPTKRWKLSPMDLASREKWVEYSEAKDVMFKYSDLKQAPWYVVEADNKRRARLNCISHLLNQIPYKDLTPNPMELPPRKERKAYVRPPITDQTFVPEKY